MKQNKHTPKELGNYIVYPNGCVESRVMPNGWKTIQPIDKGDGYKFVRLTVDGVRKKWMLHKLMAELFLGPKPSKQHEIRHLDGNRANNRIENLAYGTRKENAQDREKHGRTSRGVGHSAYIKEGIAKSKANTNLIAAAPDLLSTLEALANRVAELKPDAKAACKKQLDDACTAIAKAKGGAE